MNDISNLLKIGFPHSKISVGRMLPILIKHLNQNPNSTFFLFKEI